MRQWDVIVVGAGPAGSVAALLLARRGYDVLLLDRKRFPRAKACGDAVPASAIRILMELGLGPAIAQSQFYPLDGLRIVAPAGRIVDFPLNAATDGAQPYTVPRDVFDDLIRRAAIADGAAFEIRNVKRAIIECGRVTGVVTNEGDSHQIKARVVIAADGGGSALVRELSRERRQDSHRAIAVRGYLDGFDEIPNTVEVLLNENVLPGYQWIFPIGPRRVNIGLGMRLDEYKRRGMNLLRMLDVFLASASVRARIEPGATVTGVSSWPLNFASQWPTLLYDGLLPVGDAAGFINPLTGGGIRNALFSGVTAAVTIDRALRSGTVARRNLQPYIERCRADLRRSTRIAYFLQRSLLGNALLLDSLAATFSAAQKWRSGPASSRPKPLRPA